MWSGLATKHRCIEKDLPCSVWYSTGNTVLICTSNQGGSLINRYHSNWNPLSSWRIIITALSLRNIKCNIHAALPARKSLIFWSINSSNTWTFFTRQLQALQVSPWAEGWVIRAANRIWYNTTLSTTILSVTSIIKAISVARVPSKDF